MRIPFFPALGVLLVAGLSVAVISGQIAVALLTLLAVAGFVGMLLWIADHTD